MEPRVAVVEPDQDVVGRVLRHGFAGRMNNLATYAKVEEFLARHLGGRYQKEVRAEIRERLDALTVEVGKLTVAN